MLERFYIRTTATGTKTSLENITFLFMRLRDYFNSLNFWKHDKLTRNQIAKHGVRVKKGNEKFTVLCSRSQQNLDFGHFTLPFLQRTAEKCEPLYGYFRRNRRRDDRYWWNDDLRDWSDDLEITFRQNMSNIGQSDLRDIRRGEVVHFVFS